MARVILGSYMVRYPLGGMLSNVLQWIVGFQRLGHDVHFVEKWGYPNSCYDPVRDVMSDDCTYGTKAVADLLGRFGLGDRWCYVDASGSYHGIPRDRIEAQFGSADLFVDMGTHGAWSDEATASGLRVLVDGEPGFTQMKMEMAMASGEPLPRYDRFYSVGANIGTDRSSAPAAGRRWHHVFHPVVLDLFPARPAGPGGSFTTVMNWRSHEPIEFRGRTYGQKDVEFRRFMQLPGLAEGPLEVAVSGTDVPTEELVASGWRVRNAHEVTMSFDAFRLYVQASKAEFGVCKQVFVATNSGWFSDRSAAYLAGGKPVVLQDSGFSAHLPCGQGLFAVDTAEEAAAAIDEINGDYERHSKWAHEIAEEHLSAPRVLGRFLDEIGI